MTDADGYFSRRNHPQVMIYLPDDDDDRSDVTPGLIATPSDSDPCNTSGIEYASEMSCSASEASTEPPFYSDTDPMLQDLESAGARVCPWDVGNTAESCTCGAHETQPANPPSWWAERNIYHQKEVEVGGWVEGDGEKKGRRRGGGRRKRKYTGDRNATRRRLYICGVFFMILGATAFWGFHQFHWPWQHKFGRNPDGPLPHHPDAPPPYHGDFPPPSHGGHLPPSHPPPPPHGDHPPPHGDHPPPPPHHGHHPPAPPPPHHGDQPPPPPHHGDHPPPPPHHSGHPTPPKHSDKPPAPSPPAKNHYSLALGHPIANMPFQGEQKYTFTSPASFSFRQQSSHENRLPHGHWSFIYVTGDVYVQGVDSGNDIDVEFDIMLSHEELQHHISFEVEDEGISINVNRFAPLIPPDQSPSINIQAIISIPISYTLTKFGVHTESLNATLDPSLQVSVDRTWLGVISGNVQTSASNGFKSNFTNVKVASGDITGDFNLAHLLQLETSSGDIDTTIHPVSLPSISAEYPPPRHPHHRPPPCPKTKYIARTHSGSITSYIAPAIPLRNSHPPHHPGIDFSAEISTTSGNIVGLYPLGYFLSLSTISGDISASILQLGTSNHSIIETDTKQGSTSLSFVNDLSEGTAVDGKHSTVAGNVEVLYPGNWNGVVVGRSVVGDVEIFGRDLTIIDRRGGWGGRYVKGVKGDKGGDVEARSISGTVTVQVGEL